MPTYFKSLPKDLLTLLLQYLPPLEILREFTVPELPELNKFWNDDKFWKDLYRRDISNVLDAKTFNHFPAQGFKGDNIPAPPPCPPLPPKQSVWRAEYASVLLELKHRTVNNRIQLAARLGWDRVIVRNLTMWRQIIRDHANKKLTISEDGRCGDDEYFVDDFEPQNCLNEIKFCCAIALQCAAMNDRLHIVKMMVEDENVDPSVHDSAALVLAANFADDNALEIVKYLVDKGAEITAGSEVAYDIHDLNMDYAKDTEAPLSGALENNNLELYKYIFQETKKQIEAEIRDDKDLPRLPAEKLTSMIKSVFVNYANSKLLEAIHKHDENPETIDIIKYLVEEGGANIKEQVQFHVVEDGIEHNPRDLMHVALENNDTEVTRYLIEKGFNINNMGLDKLAGANNLEFIKELFEKGYNNEFGKCSGLITAANEGHFELVKFLVERGTDINGQPANGHMRSTPLIQACQACRHHAPPESQEIIKYLVEKGASVTYYGNEALINATMTGNLPVIKYLLANGADIKAINAELLIELLDKCSDPTDKKDESILAHDGDYLETFNFVLSQLPNVFNVKKKKKQKLSKINKLFLVAVTKGLIDLVKYCLDHGANLAWDNHKAVRIAAECGSLEILKYLHGKGADIHVSNDQSLRDACQCGHLEVVKYLVENKANLNAYNLGEFYNPLRSAGHNKHVNIVKYLVEQGADVTVLNSKERRKFNIQLNAETKKYEVKTKQQKKKQKQKNKEKAVNEMAETLNKVVNDTENIETNIDELD